MQDHPRNVLGSSAKSNLSLLRNGRHTRKGNPTTKKEACLASSGTKERIGSGACSGSMYSKASAPPKRKDKIEVPCAESMRMSPSSSAFLTTPRKKNAQQEKRELIQKRRASSSRHFLKIRRASSGLITIAPPQLFPLIDCLSQRMDASIEAADEAAISRFRLQRPSQASRVTSNGLGGSYTKQSVKPRPRRSAVRCVDE